MNTSSFPASQRAYRLLLRLYPSEFRKQYGQSMRDVFADRCRRESGRALGTLHVWAIVLPDLIKTALGLRLTRVKTRQPHRPSRHEPHGTDRRFWLGSIGQDLVFAARSLRSQPGFTVLAILTLAIGIGGNSAMFSVVNKALLNPLPFEGADRVVYVLQFHEKNRFRVPPPGAALELWRSRTKSFDVLESYTGIRRTLTGQSEPIVASGVSVSPTLLSSFGINPTLGRTFLAEDAGRTVAMISERLWQQRFGADEKMVGRTLSLNDTTYTVIGVVPSTFDLAMVSSSLDVWIAHETESFESSNRTRGLTTVARLKPGVSFEQAQVELAAIGLPEDHGWGEGWSPLLVLPHDFLGTNFAGGLLILFGAVGLVLLIACSNVANMVLARGVAREQEIGIRTALGASGGRIARLLLTESLLLSALGGLAGLLLSRWTLHAIIALAPERLASLRHVTMDGDALVFTIAVSLVTGVLFGLAPAIRLSRSEAGPLRHLNTRSVSSTRSHHMFRQVIVATEVAMALVVIVGAGLLVRSFQQLSSVDPGFELTNLGSFRLTLPEQRYPTGTARQQFFEQLLGRLNQFPGIRSVVLTSSPPAQFMAQIGAPQVDGLPQDDSDGGGLLSYTSVTPGYFEAVGTTMLRGRDFSEGDRRGESVAVVNIAFAERFWPDGTAIGKRFRLQSDDPWSEIVGVVENVKSFGLSDDPNRLQVYQLMSDFETTSAAFVIRTEGDFYSTAGQIKEQVWALDPGLPLRDFTTTRELLAVTIGRQTFLATLFSTFAIVALALAGIGIYGVVALTVNQRLHELGVRLALGAHHRDIVRSIYVKALQPVVAGIFVGMAASMALTRVVESLLFGVTPRDPVTLAVVPLLLAGVASLACFVPTRRALRVDPIQVLRAQ